MLLYRIADARHAIWDGTGAALIGGRWNSPGRPVIYASPTYSCAMLEILAHASIGRVPATHGFVSVEVPETMPIERHDSLTLASGWDSENIAIARSFGDTWIDDSRSAVLLVPSVVARLDFIALVNPMHPDAGKLRASTPQDVIWDKRLFRR